MSLTDEVKKYARDVLEIDYVGIAPADRLAGAPSGHRPRDILPGARTVVPDYGPRIRAVSVITQADLEPDPLYSGPKLCDRSKCEACIKMCPSKAIDETQSKIVEMGGRTYKYGFVHFDRCRISAEGLSIKTLGLTDTGIPDDPAPADIDKARAAAESWKRMESIGGIGGAYYCGKCLAYCPVGEKDWLKTVSKIQT